MDRQLKDKLQEEKVKTRIEYREPSLLGTFIIGMIKATNLVLEHEAEDTTGKGKAVVTTLADAINKWPCNSLMIWIRRLHYVAMKEDLHRDYASPCTSTSISPTSEYFCLLIDPQY